MASLPQLPKPISPFFKTPPSSTKPLVFLNFQILRVSVNLKKKNTWLDPFDDDEDPNNEYRSLFVDVKQEEDSRPPDNPDNPYGFLKLPMIYIVELASLPLKSEDMFDHVAALSLSVFLDVLTTDRGTSIRIQQKREMGKCL